MDEKTIAVGGIFGFVIALMTLLLGKGVDAWVKLKAARVRDDDHATKRVTRGYRLAIRELRVQVKELQQDQEEMKLQHSRQLDITKQHHAECVEEQNRMQVELTELRRMLDGRVQ